MKAREIAELVGGKLCGDGDAEILSVADIADASTGQIAFIAKPSELKHARASCVLLPPDSDGGAVPSSIAVSNPKLAFAKVAAVLHPPKKHAPHVHPTAVVSPSAKIGRNVFIGALCRVGENSTVGDGTQLLPGTKIGDDVTVGTGCIFHPNVVVEDQSVIGNAVVLYSGVVVGAAGFGYVKDERGEYHQFPQIGKVVIEDNVEIGANTCVDRGALGETRIGEGTKIDNLVQVGHNVQIGKRCVIAAQTGISGSTVIEDDCVIGGQVGFGDHARVQSGAVIGSQAGVLPGKIVRPGVWWGTPIQPLDEYKRQNAHVKSIERLKATVKDLQARLDKDLPRGTE